MAERKQVFYHIQAENGFLYIVNEIKREQAKSYVSNNDKNMTNN
jgi:hypothetical protein